MNLTARLRLDRGAFRLDLDLDVEQGRTLALIGPNGAGKSTALGALAGVLPNSGSISLGDRVLDDVEIEHRRVGYVFQDYLLFPHLSVVDNVAFGPRSQHARRSVAAARAAAWLDRLGIADLASRLPAELSGGQAQRVALARALAAEPELLLLDEPLAALDVEVRGEVRTELARHLSSWGRPTIVVAHDIDDVVALADEVIVIEHGRATQRATVAELFARPATPYIARLVSGPTPGATPA
jgi:molybdate transport system ATP-binding protein